VVASVTCLLWLAGAANLASAEEVSATLHRLGDADLVLISDPAGARPVRVLLATRVASPVDKVRQVIADPSAYGKAMPSFRRVEVVSKHERGPGVTDVEVAWELEVPLRNLSGKLWLRSQEGGVDLQLVEGDFAPGLFHLSARKAKSGSKAESVLTRSVLTRSVLTIEGFANVRDANWATRQIVQRSSTAEPAITVAAAYVMLKSLARLAEGALSARPNAAMTAPEPASLNGALAGQTAHVVAPGKRVLAAVRSGADGRLLNVAVAVHVAAPADLVTRRTLQPRPFVHMPGWKKITPVSGNPEVCKDTAALCWKVDTNLPVFSLDGIWKIRPRPWRAHMVDGDNKGAVMGIDVLPGKASGRSTLVLSQHPRLDTAGYVARKLIAAEPFLEHGLALALTLVEAVALAPALEKD
jgi:hypothetical protein